MPPPTTATTACNLPAHLTWFLALAGTGAPKRPRKLHVGQQQHCTRIAFRSIDSWVRLSDTVRRSFLPHIYVCEAQEPEEAKSWPRKPIATSVMRPVVVAIMNSDR